MEKSVRVRFPLRAPNYKNKPQVASFYILVRLYDVARTYILAQSINDPAGETSEKTGQITKAGLTK